MADATETRAVVPEVTAAVAVDGAAATVANGHAKPAGSSNSTDPEKHAAALNGLASDAAQNTADKPATADNLEDTTGKPGKPDTDKPADDVSGQKAGASLGAGVEPPEAEVDSTPGTAQVDANSSIANEPAVMDSTKKDVAADDTAPAAPTTADEVKPADTTPALATDAAADDAKKADVDGDAAAGDAETATETRADGAEDANKKNDDAPAADADKEAAAEPAADTAATTPAKPAKTAAAIARRKSVGQKLNRKGSKARIVHLDAKPGDHFFVKLKGYPAWPVIICDEDMLPQTLIKSRPVTAARQDGTYREDYADGGKRAADRTFPVMYLFTNEFGWVPNQDLHDLDPSKVLDAITDKMRKDLQEAHRIAADHNPLTFFKDMLRQFQEELERAEEEARLAVEAKKIAKKAKEADVDMLDVPADDDEAPPVSTKKSRKRKADEDAQTPQRSNSVKKPKIKITSSGTPKSGAAPTAKSGKTEKASKPKPKSSKSDDAKAAAPPEPELSPEEKIKRKSKEVLFLRHKIQKGLLTNNVEPKPEEMKLLSDYLTKLEGFPNLEVDVIRATKIHKVLKAILKIPFIPREDEFTFKPRSQVLLDKWNKRLAAEPAVEDPEKKKHSEANGVTNGHSEKKEANGVKDHKDEPAAADEAKEPAAVEAAA